MGGRSKRTYKLTTKTVERVRELSARYGLAPSQDAVVRLAGDRLDRDVREREDAEAWARAADDPGFRAEMRDIAEAYRDRDAWPAG